MEITLLKAESADLPAVAALMNAAFRGTPSDRSWSVETGYISGERTNETLLREELAEGAHLLLVRDAVTSLLQGCVSLRALSPERWYLGSLTIHPELQNAGFGRVLLDAAEKYAAQQGACEVEMTVVNLRDSLLAWYERRGYVRTGEMRDFPYGDDRFGTPLRDDLQFVVLTRRL